MKEYRSSLFLTYLTSFRLLRSAQIIIRNRAKHILIHKSTSKMIFSPNFFTFVIGEKPRIFRGTYSHSKDAMTLWY